MRGFAPIVLCASFLLVATGVEATPYVFTGTLLGFGPDEGPCLAHNTVDPYYFVQNSPGTTTFDILSYLKYPTYMNSEIFLFRDDGHLDGADIWSLNDDANVLQGRDDGSVSALDSYLLLFTLPAGKYVLLVGDFLDAPSSVVDLVQEHAMFLPVSGGHYANSAQYQLTITGDVTVTSTPNTVPEPGTLLLIASGLASLAFRRRHRTP